MKKRIETEKKIPVLTANELHEINSPAYVKTDRETTLAELLTRYMNELKAKGITEQDISHATGITKSCISSYLHGSKTPSLETLLALCIGMRLYYGRIEMLLQIANKSLCIFSNRDCIVKKYLVSCAVCCEFDVASCNQELKEKHFQPLTKK